MRVWPVILGAGALSWPIAAAAAPPKLPYEFDLALAADQAGTQKGIAEGEALLPALPTAPLSAVQLGAVKLWMWPTSVSLMQAAATSGPGAMSWPKTPSLCTRHASFSLPAVAQGAPDSCAEARTDIAEELGALGACADVEQPERYVLGYEAAKVDLNVTSTLEGLVGLAGEAISRHPIPENLLPQDFPETLRRVLVKLRSKTLTTNLGAAKAAYGRATAIATQNASCFAAGTLAIELASLGAELDAASAHIAKLESEGKAETDHESVCLAAKSRARRALPFPSLTRAEREFVAFYLGGTYWRMRGGGVMPLGSTQAARLYFLLQPFTRIGELTGATDGADAAFQIYLGVFEGWGDWMDMGTTPGGGDKFFDLVAMTNRGHRQVKGAVELLAQRSYDTAPLVTGGLEMGPCYYFSFDQLQSFKYAYEVSPPYGDFILGFTASGEFCSGASIALGLARTLLDGTPTGQPPTANLCANRMCGDDGCGGTCGSCAAGLTCGGGVCLEVDAAGPVVPVAPAPSPTPPANRLSTNESVPPGPADAGCGCAAAKTPRGRWVATVLFVGLFAARRRRHRAGLLGGRGGGPNPG